MAILSSAVTSRTRHPGGQVLRGVAGVVRQRRRRTSQGALRRVPLEALTGTDTDTDTDDGGSEG